MISVPNVTDDTTAQCDQTIGSGLVPSMVPTDQVAVAQMVQAAATIVGLEATNCNNAFPVSNVEYGKKESDEFLTEAEFALLSHVTTTIGDFDPLSKDNIEKRNNFIPILEARGGSDKDEQGHRRDTVPIANAIDELQTASKKTHTAVFQFLEENAGLSTHSVMTNDALKKYLKRVAHGIIIRINPGTLSPASQKKCDDMLRELSAVGIVILSHPDVAMSLGAKDVSDTLLHFITLKFICTDVIFF